MKTETRTIFICEFCGQEHHSKDWMELHEIVCSKNPTNQPCSQCRNLILGMGCARGVDADEVGGNVLCFCYEEGTPVNPHTAVLKLNGDMSSFYDNEHNTDP